MSVSTQLSKKVFSALLYALSSFMITVVNKTVLTTYAFPSYQVLGLGQTLATIIILWCGRYTQIIRFPSLTMQVVRYMGPLPHLYLANMVTGLGGTKELSLPMFTALRRFAILMTMIGERIVLGTRASFSVQYSVLAMIAGAIIAAVDDVTYSQSGYTLVLLNNTFTAANGLYIKKKLDTAVIDKYGIMYYNALFIFTPAVFILWFKGDLSVSFGSNLWSDPIFLVHFFMSCIMGFVLSYSIMLCTQYNGALTTTVVGCIKNISVTYLGMVIGGDYVFSWWNFVGLNISVVASLVYTYFTFNPGAGPVDTSKITGQTSIGH